MTVDVLIVGAGPAGSVAALALARAGADVLLVDKARFPRDKVCGGCLGPAALAALQDLGIAVPAGPELQSLELRVGRRVARVALPRGRSLSRASLDMALLDAARDAGASVRTGTPARLGPIEGETRRVDLGEQSLHARLVLAADGLGGGLLAGGAVAAGSRIGLGARLGAVEGAPPPGSVTMVCGASGYVGLVRDETDGLTVAAAVDGRAVRARGAAGAVADILASAGCPALPPAEWRGTPALTRGPAPAAERVLPLGDAAGYVEPFTGEGIGWAIASAMALAPLARDGWSRDLPRRWERARRAVVRQRACRVAAAVLRRPALVGLLAALLDRAPSLASPLLAAVHRR